MDSIEALKLEMGKNPERDPDFGPNQVGPAGATVIGARQPLIAYNIYLTTDDISIANKIARTIRFSSGGFRFVKALGMLVEGKAQISMNLTNYHKTSLSLVVETIRREASRYGVMIYHAELVGLIPQAALVDAAVWYMQLDKFKPEQILEEKLYSLQQESRAQSDEISEFAYNFLDALAAGTATPGGGSAAAYSGAAAASLVSMVARLTIGKKKYADVENTMQTILTQAESLRNDLTLAIQQDAAAFENVLMAYKLPKNSSQEQEVRQKAIEQATLLATQSPISVAHKSYRVLELSEQVIKYGNASALSDSATAAALARAAFTSAGYNIRINAKVLPSTIANSILSEFTALDKQITEIESRIQKILHERGLVADGFQALLLSQGFFVG